MVNAKYYITISLLVLCFYSCSFGGDENTVNNKVDSHEENEANQDELSSIDVNNIEKDTVITYKVVKDTDYDLCLKWQVPESGEILSLLYEMVEITGNEWNVCYGDWSCGAEGVLYFNKEKYNYYLDACGWIILTNKDRKEQRYFGCRSDKCWKYFPAESDCDEKGNPLH